MNLFNVYPLYDITPVRAKDCLVYDEKGTEYLDLYGGHGVISVGHTHPHYVQALKNQLDRIGFYSNAIQNPVQEALANKLGELSGYADYDLFLCSSGAEANENALKLASFYTGKARVVAFHNAFHGRTSAAVAVTDNEKINAPINKQQRVNFLPLNDLQAVEKELAKGDVGSVIIEGIQGVGGLDQGSTEFFQDLEKICRRHEVVLILDEVQSGYGRSGQFFAHQFHGIRPDIITVAKGMGNGFPVGGVLISPKFEAVFGMLGTTFGGNHLACAAGLAVLEIMEQEKLMENTRKVSDYIIERAQQLPQVKNIKGRGLMLGLEFDFEVAALRKQLIMEGHIFTGSANNKKLLRILPPLTLQPKHVDLFFETLKRFLKAQ